MRRIAKLLELTPKLDVHFILAGWNSKVGSQKIPEIVDMFDLGVQNKARQRLTVLSREQVSGYVKEKRVWHATVHRVAKSWTWLSDWTMTRTIMNYSFYN